MIFSSFKKNSLLSYFLKKNFITTTISKRFVKNTPGKGGPSEEKNFMISCLKLLPHRQILLK